MSVKLKLLRRDIHEIAMAARRDGDKIRAWFRIAERHERR